MPLMERDVNTQRDVSRNKGHSIQADLSFTRLRDENSPSLRRKSPKTTPPSQRLRAQTKASAAKVTSSPRAATPSTSQSKLPRRSTPKWTTRIADRIASGDRTASKASELQRQREGAESAPCEETSIHNHTQALHASQANSLLANKPLPSRPIASFINEMSPTKDSRTLIDACEQPLTISVDGAEHAWPALTPYASGTTGPQQPYHDSTLSSGCEMRLPSMSEQLPRLRPDNDHVQRDAECERSSSGTFFSEEASFDGSDHLGQAAQEASKVLQTHRRQISRSVDSGSASREGAFPPRRASLCDQEGDEYLAKPHSVFAGLSQVPRAPTPDSRTHSPSPASSSRLRPGSMSLARSVPSPAPITSPATTARAQKTASRIPIPDSKKATLVDVRSRCPSSTSSRPEPSPSFGSRRLDAPDTLKILDQGIKRRQLRRTETMGTATTAASNATRAFDVHELPAFDRSSTSTPDHTFGTSSEDEDEITTPTFKPNVLARSESIANLAETPGDHYYYGRAAKLFDSTVASLHDMPPTTSPYAAPLQTIPSQSVLTTSQDMPQGDSPKHKRQISGFTEMNKRLSTLSDAHTEHTAAHIGERAPVPESTRFSLMELLKEYAMEDRLLHAEGNACLDEETRKHITRTLSVLEGGGSPPKTEVDHEILLQMFGHMKRGIEKAQKTTSLLGNAAAAERYLGRVSAADDEYKSDDGIDEEADHSRNTELIPSAKSHLPPIEPVASKWSESSTSLQVASPTDGTSPRTSMFWPAPLVIPMPRRLQPDPPRSIGFPSRIPSKANALIGPSASSTPSPTEHLRRLSSPTLGLRKPGSIKAARETLHQVQGGFARTTASAESKKSAKTPTSKTKPLQVPDKDARGRTPSAEKVKQKPDMATPRARSKSRFVLDKINGLFSGKPGKRSSILLPLPSTAEHREQDRDVEITADESPMVRYTRTPPVTKMPTLSPPELSALRSASSSGSLATPVDSVTDGDDLNPSQSLHKWSAVMIRKAAKEANIARKERLLSFAKVLNDFLISAREAQISAETAQAAAKSAQLSYEMTQQSVAMLQRLAAVMISPGRGR